jgi:hypothetical protein
MAAQINTHARYIQTYLRFVFVYLEFKYEEVPAFTFFFYELKHFAPAQKFEGKPFLCNHICEFTVLSETSDLSSA